jgi:regulator of CtrA degradation
VLAAMPVAMVAVAVMVAGPVPTASRTAIVDAAGEAEAEADEEQESSGAGARQRHAVLPNGTARVRGRCIYPRAARSFRRRSRPASEQRRRSPSFAIPRGVRLCHFRVMTGEEAHVALTPKLVASLYTEAMLLADEARSYFERQGRDDRDGLDPIVRVAFSCESLKVTTRLMHVIAWLLTQRAVDAGELSPLQARTPARRLGEAPDTDAALLPTLPGEATTLIEASRDLYARVRRLDEHGAEAAGPPQASPARSLLSRLERSF